MAFIMKMLQQLELLERLQQYLSGQLCAGSGGFLPLSCFGVFFSQTECAICVVRKDFVLLRC